MSARDLDPADPMAALVREGSRLNGLAQFVAAHDLLERGLRLADGMDAGEREFWTARLLITKAYSTMEVDDLRAGLAELELARTTARSIGSARLRSLAGVQESYIHSRATHWAESVQAANRAEAEGGHLEPEEWYALFLNRGFARVELRLLDAAETDLRAALAVAREASSPVLLFKAIHNLGCLEWVRGDLPRALQLMQEADELVVDLPRDRAWVDQAQVLIEAGLVDRAQRRLMDALTTARREHHRLDEGAIHLDLARCALHEGSLATARAEATTALARFVEGRAEHRALRTELMLASIDLAEGVNVEGVEGAARAWLDRRGGPAEDRAALRLLAEALLARGAVTESAATLAGGEDLPALGAAAELHEWLLRIRLAAARGDPREVHRLCRSAARRLSAHQSQVQSLELRAAVALHGRRIADFDVNEALAHGSVGQVFTSVERWRSASLRTDPVQPVEDPQVRRLLVELRQARQRARTSDTRSQIEALEDAITQRELTRPKAARERTLVRSVSAARARRAAAGAGVTVVEFFSAEQEVHAILVTGNRLIHRRLGPQAPMAAAIRRLLSDLRGRATAMSSPLLRDQLSAALNDSVAQIETALAPAFADVPTDPLILVPGGLLAGLPWALLPSLAGRPLVVSPSATRWVGLVEAASSERAPERAPESLRVSILGGPGLSHVAEEADAVGSAWSLARTRVRPLASSREVRRSLERADVVHIAAHGTHEDQNPLFSSLHLSDGPLFIHEFPRHARASHVVLSACDVGRSRMRPGDEPLGFAAALLAHGIQSVVASVAPVPDQAAAAAMAIYHRDLAGGIPASAALAHAIGAVPEAGAFCLFGSDWRAAAGSRLR